MGNRPSFSRSSSLTSITTRRSNNSKQKEGLQSSLPGQKDVASSHYHGDSRRRRRRRRPRSRRRFFDNDDLASSLSPRISSSSSSTALTTSDWFGLQQAVEDEASSSTNFVDDGSATPCNNPERTTGLTDCERRARSHWTEPPSGTTTVAPSSTRGVATTNATTGEVTVPSSREQQQKTHNQQGLPKEEHVVVNNPGDAFRSLRRLGKYGTQDDEGTPSEVSNKDNCVEEVAENPIVCLRESRAVATLYEAAAIPIVKEMENGPSLTHRTHLVKESLEGINQDAPTATTAVPFVSTASSSRSLPSVTETGGDRQEQRHTSHHQHLPAPTSLSGNGATLGSSFKKRRSNSWRESGGSAQFKKDVLITIQENEELTTAEDTMVVKDKETDVVTAGPSSRNSDAFTRRNSSEEFRKMIMSIEDEMFGGCTDATGVPSTRPAIVDTYFTSLASVRPTSTSLLDTLSLDTSDKKDSPWNDSLFPKQQDDGCSLKVGDLDFATDYSSTSATAAMEVVGQRESKEDKEGMCNTPDACNSVTSQTRRRFRLRFRRRR